MSSLSAARDTYPSPPENDDFSSDVSERNVSEGEPHCSFWQILILLGVGVVLVGVPLVVVIACCVRDDGGSEVSQPPSLPQPSTSTGPNDSEPGTTEAELGARADSTRARCDVKSIKTAGEKKIIWTFWHAKMPPLRVQQMIESWKERAPTWQVCQTYLWDNVGETRHFGPSARTRGVDIATVGTTGFLSYTQNPDYFLNNCRPPDPDYEGGVDTTRAVTVWRGGGGRT